MHRILVLGFWVGVGCAPSSAPDAAFVVDPTCGRAEPLGLVLGEPGAQGAFVALSEAQPPTRIYGPQGGQHLLVDLWIGDPSAEADAVLVALEASRAPAAADTAAFDDPSLGRVEVITRLGDPQFQPAPEGGLRLGSYFLVLGAWPEQVERRLEASVQDTCGRRATTSLTIAALAQGGPT
jgi:hypothetical protein